MTRLRGSSESDYQRPEGVDERAVMTAFRVPAEVAGQRVDVFIQSQLHRTSRTRAQFIVRASAYDSGGRALRSNDRVRAGQEIVLWRAPWDETAVPTDLPILYEDEHILAVDKPANLPVHPTARYHRNTLIKLLQAERPGEFVSLGHRLDRETSGVLLVSKTPTCDRALKRNLEQREGIEKTYVAITRGIPNLEVGTMLRFERNVELDLTSRYKVKMCVSDSPDSLYAATRFLALEVRAGAEGTPYTLVRCELETGRQHQIRVHLAALGAYIVGDKLYGHDESAFARAADGELTAADLVLLETPRHALHAAAISLAHPITGQALHIEAPLPTDMRDFWASLATL